MGFEVAYDPSNNIKIVKTIEKYPVLYDFKKYPPVEYKTLSDEAWDKSAVELGVSEGYLKGRWTNIKGCFKRYLKNKARSGKTKDYYLAKYLQFMIPFMSVSREVRQAALRFFEEEHKMCPVKSEIIYPAEDMEVKLVDSEGEEERFIITAPTDNSDEEELEKSADWDFFSSLLPDIQRMNPDQKSRFKNAILTAIDTALYGEDL